jgi:ubiquinol-cytochrome c reductase cytochrome b subunit
MNSLFTWFDNRTGIGNLLRAAAEPRCGRACWCKVWPTVVAFLFCVQAISGFFLWVYYSPSAQTAWESVYHLQHDVPGGWWLRAVHHYAAHVLIAVLLIYVVQSVLTRACRAPRELVFWTAVGLGLFALAAVLTGDLLSWDQNGYAATKTRTGFLNFLPIIGQGLLKVAIGGPGPALGHLTLTRFFALHVGLFGGGFLFLLVVHWILYHRAATVLVAGDTVKRSPWWPAQAWRDAVVCVLVMIVVLLLAHWLGVPLLSPADTDPANEYAAARPEWFLTGVFEFSHIGSFREMPIVPIFILPGVVLCVVLVMPWLAAARLGHAFNVLFTLALLGGLAWLTQHSLAKDRADAAHQKAIALEERLARRVGELIRHEGIPPLGALELLRNDPKTQGPRLFVQQCASCHDHAVPGGDPLEEIRAAESSAPNLGGYATRPWIAGLLDPKRINGPDYFGKTKFRGGKMAGFVKDTLAELDADEKKNLTKVIAAVSAEAHLPTQAELDAKDAKLIDEGRKLLVDDFGCTDCHRFRGKGALGDAPDLTGYGSAEWLSGIVRNPADKRFYGARNDRMPAYAPADDPKQNTLDRRQIDLIVDWLRGQWPVASEKSGM